MDDHVYKRKKRGIKLLGSLISALMDLPGPDDFLHQVSITNDLSAIVKGSLVPGIKKLSHSITAEKNFLNDSFIQKIDETTFTDLEIINFVDSVLIAINLLKYLINLAKKSSFGRKK